eukprot:TRINITY_DN880_c0_g1_i3.p1 TRINITY_DN880_c0_g1~~TRINITY_DN880_c0_g1_i3.p1  ORF type:complete len:364 (+),score=52.43 TRINITY_DN880_c0_g1_i3:52-1143(+)
MGNTASKENPTPRPSPEEIEAMLKKCDTTNVMAYLKEWFSSPATAIINESTGETLLHIVVRLESSFLFREIIERGADVNTKCSSGLVPLAIALFNNCSNTGIICSLLARMDYDGINEVISDTRCPPINHFYGNSNKCQLFYLAAKGAKVEVLERLLKDHGADIDIDMRCSVGSTPLHGALYYGALENVEYLAKSGADCNLTNKNGHTPYSEILHETRARPYDALDSVCNPEVIPTFLSKVQPTEKTIQAWSQRPQAHLEAEIEKFTRLNNRACVAGILSAMELDESGFTTCAGAALVHSPEFLSAVVNLPCLTPSLFKSCLESQNVSSPQHPCGESTIFASLTESNSSFLMPLMNHCFGIDAN